MSKPVTSLSMQSRFQRMLVRMPILLYRARLGRLMGGRFLLLTHTGRISGKPRQTVLEVLRHDQAEDFYVIAAAWGEQSDWFRNIQKTPAVRAQVGRRKVAATTTRLSIAEAEIEFRSYAKRYPHVANQIFQRAFGASPSEEADLLKLAELVPLIAVRPV